MIIYNDQLDKFRENSGNKAINLKLLIDHGFNVPKFVVIPNFEVKKIFENKKYLDDLIMEIKKNFICDLYAIRSNALIEDSKNASFAGQFSTKLKCKIENIGENIIEVLEQANNFLNENLDKFSFIIQEFIDPDFAGVTFTRNPKNGREMNIEYIKGMGESLVGGQVKPFKLAFYWNENLNHLETKLYNFKNAIGEFKKIENFFKFPQDIEWCIKNHILYFLQTRPVTTISNLAYEQMNFLDKNFSLFGKYFFEKTEISEIAPRPSSFTFSLLKKIYENEGPIDNVYKEFGINYFSTDFLKIIGNELFIDRENELNSILPAYSYFNNYKPRIKNFKGIYVTIKNLINLNTIHSDPEKLKDEIYFKVKNNIDKNLDLKTLLNNFLKDYELIFKINLLTAKSFKTLENALKKKKITLINILNLKIENFSFGIEVNFKNLKGNSLEISDISEFVYKWHKHEEDETANKWYKNLKSWEQKFYLPIIKNAKKFNLLREYGRWLTVKHVNLIRIKILQLAENAFFKDVNNVYFSTLDEVISNKLNENECIKRKNVYEKSNKFNLPSRLTDHLADIKNNLVGVSAGEASGKLIDSSTINEKGDKILYTKILSPDLTKYFKNIKGIVSEEGGLLSHLSIMARENRLPVLVNFDLKNSDIKLGDEILINCDKGEIKKII